MVDRHTICSPEDARIAVIEAKPPSGFEILASEAREGTIHVREDERGIAPFECRAVVGGDSAAQFDARPTLRAELWKHDAWLFTGRATTATRDEKFSHPTLEQDSLGGERRRLETFAERLHEFLREVRPRGWNQAIVEDSSQDGRRTAVGDGRGCLGRGFQGRLGARMRDRHRNERLCRDISGAHDSERFSGATLEVGREFGVTRGDRGKPPKCVDAHGTKRALLFDKRGLRIGRGRKATPDVRRFGCPTGCAQVLAARELNAHPQVDGVGDGQRDVESRVAHVGLPLREFDEVPDQLCTKGGRTFPPRDCRLRGARSLERNSPSLGALRQFKERNRGGGIVGARSKTRAQDVLCTVWRHEHAEGLVTGDHDAVTEHDGVPWRLLTNPRKDAAFARIKDEKLFKPRHENTIPRD